jgi:hypothetical protein
MTYPMLFFQRTSPSDSNNEYDLFKLALAARPNYLRTTGGLVDAKPRPDQFTDYESYDTPGWDGMNAAPIAPETLNAARRFSAGLPREPAPDIAAGPPGVIGFEWTLALSDGAPYLLVEVGPGERIQIEQIRKDGQARSCTFGSMGMALQHVKVSLQEFTDAI